MFSTEFLQGAAAFHAGASWFDNPYDIDSEDDAWDEWQDGYEAAEVGAA